MPKIKFAVIGQGHIGKRHAEMVRRNPECELIAVCDVMPKDKIGLTDLKEKFYQNIDDLLKAHPEVDFYCPFHPRGFLIRVARCQKKTCEEKISGDAFGHRQLLTHWWHP